LNFIGEKRIYSDTCSVSLEDLCHICHISLCSHSENIPTKRDTIFVIILSFITLIYFKLTCISFQKE